MDHALSRNLWVERNLERQIEAYHKSKRGGSGCAAEPEDAAMPVAARNMNVIPELSLSQPLRIIRCNPREWRGGMALLPDNAIIFCFAHAVRRRFEFRLSNELLLNASGQSEPCLVSAP